MKDGRIHKGVTHRIGFWKAEDYQKFTFPASEMVLGGMLLDNHYHVWVLIVRIVELVFSCGRNGWTQDSLKLFKNLIWQHNILYRWKFSRYEKFTKSLKTGFLHLFICKTTADHMQMSS